MGAGLIMSRPAGRGDVEVAAGTELGETDSLLATDPTFVVLIAVAAVVVIIPNFL